MNYLVEWIGRDRMTCEDHKNRSHPITAGDRGQVMRAKGVLVHVRWDLGGSEWVRRTSVKAI